MVGKILAIEELENSPINGPGPIPEELCLHFKRVAIYKIKPIWKIKKGEVTKTLPSISQLKFCLVEWKGFAQKFGVNIFCMESLAESHCSRSMVMQDLAKVFKQSKWDF